MNSPINRAMRRDRLARHAGTPNSRDAIPPTLFVLWLDAILGGDITVGGIYATEQEAKAADERVGYPHRFKITPVPFNRDLFAQVIASKIERVPDPPQQTPEA